MLTWFIFYLKFCFFSRSEVPGFLTACIFLSRAAYLAYIIWLSLCLHKHTHTHPHTHTQTHEVVYETTSWRVWPLELWDIHWQNFSFAVFSNWHIYSLQLYYERDSHEYFPLNLPELLRIPSLTDISGRLFLSVSFSSGKW